MGSVSDVAQQPTRRELILGLGRAFGGSLLFALPILMTMEMWRFGAVLSPLRIAAFVALTLPLLVALARELGVRDTPGMAWGDHIADAFVAFAVGATTSAVVLALFGLIGPSRSLSEVMGLVAIESVPTSIGAAIARGEFTTGAAQRGSGSATYPAEMLLMAVGAGVLSFNIAPTEEVVLLAAVAGPLRLGVLAVLSVAIMHAVVYLLGFRGQHRSEASAWSVFLGYSVAGYAVALVVALLMLWVFGRTDEASWTVVVSEMVVLGFPGGLGAAAARLIL